MAERRNGGKPRREENNKTSGSVNERKRQTHSRKYDVTGGEKQIKTGSKGKAVQGKSRQVHSLQYKPNLNSKCPISHLCGGCQYVDMPYEQQLAEKQRIAELASQFLKPSSTYFFDSSSTASILATRLSDYPDVKIATNGVAILSNMQSTDKLSILSTGGYLRSPWDELTGNLAIKCIENMNADVFFFSCAGFTVEQGAMELSDDNVAVKRVFYRNSKLRILLCDSTKIGKLFFFNSFSISEIDYIITDCCPAYPGYVELLGDKLIY